MLLSFTGGNQVANNAVVKRGSGTAKESLIFGAISDGKKVIVNWSTANERSFDYFTVERSKDGVNFVSAVMIKGAGAISTFVDYTDIDYCPFSGISYYRLKQTDYSGQSFYSETVAVNFQFLKDGSVVPFTGAMPDISEIKALENKTLLVVVRDIKGAEYVSKIQVTTDKDQLYATDIKNFLNQGVYVVVASSSNLLCGQKVLVK